MNGWRRNYKGLRKLKKIKAIFYKGIIGLFLVIFLFPYWYTVISAFKSRIEAFAYPPIWIFKPVLENFKIIFLKHNILFYIKNSFIITVVSTLLTLVLAVPATYSLVRFRSKYKEGMAYGMLAMQLLPAIGVVFSFFTIAQTLNIVDTHIILIVVYLLWNIPWAIWIMRGFFETIPIEIEECAMIDGCTQFGAFLRVVLPLAITGIVATGTIIFIACWNEFTLAFFLTSRQARTLPTTISFFLTHQGIEWGPMFATTTISTLPIIVIAFAVRKYFVSALTFGAVKG